MLNPCCNVLTMQFKSVHEAPNYLTGENEGEGFKAAKILKAVIVRGGMENGKDTVDLQFEDEAGNKYVTMITGTLLQQLASTVNQGK